MPPHHALRGPSSSRLVSIDALRGFAILGILLVNCAYLGLPSRVAGELPPAELRTGLDVAAWAFVKAFAELKFVTLFSFLFGIGFAMQSERADREGDEGFGVRYARRLVLLALLGVLHGVLLFMGDILFCYACCGFVLLAGRRLPARSWLVAGVVLALLLVPWIAGLTALDASEASPVAEVASGASQDLTVLEAFAAPLELDGPRLAALETQLYSEGPLLQQIALRAGSFVVFLFVCAFYFGWRSFAFFCLGVAAWRLGLFAQEGRRARRRLRSLGLAVGLPLTLWATWQSYLGAAEASPGGAALGAGLEELASLVLPAGYAGWILCWAESGAGRLREALAAVGRMALTNYIGQSLLLAWVMCHWGLGLFGRLDLPLLLGSSVAVFVVQLVLSPLWLTRFRMGPLEWLWRWGTYGARPAFRR